jgi:uncharacterized membrane protein YjjP (DUF1212 family)
MAARPAEEGDIAPSITVQPAPPHRTDPADFVVRLARALHEQGMACHHLESLLGRVADKLGLKAQMLSLPTAFLVSFTDRTGPRKP